ncbi:hypothetical protein HOU90_gp009 [Lactobacillus phage Lpa804]|uniref:DUF4815 domain-containing protein n=1 Tax=Lactobacillus phage Lpa804 TaxID=2059850 RepID=A0A3Q8CVE9_9CAUD|nr:hypothetical protein HOU90_gp009 [Lactobacillus phage Lpa804]AUG84639.1 hypothetical protein Lpa804_9 [Lactobacillus phage Lpa804]
MPKYDDSQSPYNNGFDANKRFSKVLFRPGRPAFSQEILEMESMQNYNTTMLGDTLFQEGAIISGMNVIPKTFTNNGGTTVKYPNNFSVKTATAINSALTTTTYTSDGVIGVNSVGAVKTDYPGMSFETMITKGLYSTLHFKITKTSGTLSKISFDYDTTKMTPISYNIDNKAVATALNDMTGTPLVDSSGSPIMLDTNADHDVVIVFQTLDSANTSLSLMLNSGYNALTTGVNVNITNLMSEDGKVAHDWSINSNDGNATSSINRTKVYGISSGRIWLEGAVRSFDGDEISIKGIGTEIIGAVLNETVVTSTDDSDLLDHTSGSDTYGLAGADRTKYQVTLTYNDPTATPIFVFVDNHLNSNELKPDYGSLGQILAKRMYDQSGSFRVSGFDVSVRDYSLDSSKLQLVVDAGQAYVRGYSINTTENTNLLIDKAEQTEEASNEQYIYDSDNGVYTFVQQPVQTVASVTASVQGSNASVPRSSTGITDQFSTEAVYRIESVTQGSTAYIEGTDFVRISTNSIRWGQDANGNVLTGAKKPAAGSTYRVIYDYTKVLTEDKDYKVIVNGGTTKLDIANQNGLKPIAGSIVNVDYVYFLARIDMILITSDINNPFKIIKGTPMTFSTVTPPIVNDPYTLELGYVLVYPGTGENLANKALFTMQTVTNIPFSGLQKWSTRLDNLEYNLAVQQLSAKAKEDEDPTTVKDAFSDSFNSVNTADTFHDGFAVDYAPADGEIRMPTQYNYTAIPTVAEDYSTSARIWHTSDISSQALATSGLSSSSGVVDQQQLLSTGIINVNEYQVFNVNGTLKLVPDTDNWIDTNNTTVIDTSSRVKKLRLNQFWKSDPKNYSRYYKGNTLNYFNKITLDNGQKWTTTRTNSTYSGYIISSGGTKTVSSAIEYMRQRRLHFKASNFKPYADNLRATIMAAPVDSVLWGPDDNASNVNPYRGSEHDTWKADGNGEVYGSFVIPAGIRCGDRTVTLYNKDNLAYANYSAHGTLKNVENIINKQRVAVTLYDPLAQSFTFTENRHLQGVDLFFQSKATTNVSGHTSDVIIQVRELSDDGYPNKTIRSEIDLSPSQINTSKDGSVATHIDFERPIQLTGTNGYCIIIITDSNQYNVFKATRGERRLDNNNVMQSRPSDNGNLFTSSNAQTWVADPNSSLKYKLYTSRYNTRSTITWNPVSLNSVYFDNSNRVPVSTMDRFTVLTSYLTPDSTAINFYYRLLPDSSASNANISNIPWNPLVVVNDNTSSSTNSTGTNADDITGEYAMSSNTRQIQIKADIVSTSTASPLLELDDLTIAFMKANTVGNYYSVNVDESGSAEFNTVKMQYDAYIPTGTSVTPTYSVDGGNTWYTLTSTGSGTATPESSEQISPLFKRYIYNGKVPTAVDANHLANQIMFNLNMKTNSNFIKPRVRKLMTTMSNK